MADLIQKTDTLNQGREKLNEAIKEADKAKWDAGNAVNIASQALSKSESTQSQLDTIVIEGDSSVEAAQARVPVEGTAYRTLKERLDTEYETITEKMEADRALVDNSRDIYFSKLDYQELLAKSVTTIHDGAGSRFSQSAVIDYANRKYYIARQTTGEYNDQRLYEYDLLTNILIRSKDIPTANYVYIEGLVFFYNTQGQICFIIPTERFGKFGIFNYETGILEKEFAMEGSFKVGVDNNRKFFLCSKHSNYEDLNNTMNGILLYDLDSVIAGTPLLVKTVNFFHNDLYRPKIQGLTMIDDLIFLGRGVQSNLVTVIDTNGNTLYSVTHDKAETLSLIGGNPAPGDAQQIESEGITWVKENGITYPVIFIATQGLACLIKLGDTSKQKIKKGIMQEGSNAIAEIASNPVFNLVGSIGNAYLRVESSQDLYGRILELPGNGLYTLFASGSATNAPVGGASIRGTVQVDRFINGVPDILSIIAQDFRGSVWSNYYDANASPKWRGWSHIGGHSAQISGSTFNPLSDAIGPGKYETQSGVNAPTNTGKFGTIREYSIDVGASGRKQVICINNDTDNSDTFINTRKTDGTWTGWKKFTLTSV